MELKKTVSVDGRIDIQLDGKDLDFELSRKVTGTTGERDRGVFSRENSERFEFGDFCVVISFETQLIPTWLIEDFGQVLEGRILKVCDWVEDCRSTAGTVYLNQIPGEDKPK